MYQAHNLIEALCWGKVLEVARVGNLSRCPIALVVWVVNQRGKPFALVKWIRLVRTSRIGIRGNNIGERANSFTASTRRSQEPRRTWSSEQSERPSRRLPHHPTLRASQHLDGKHKNISRRPTLQYIRTGIRNSQGFIIEPAFRLLSILIEDLIGLVLIPVIGLLGIGIRNAFDINPIPGLFVLRIVYLFRRVD